MKNNRICELLGIDYPIFQGAMAWISGAELAAAVSEAGALGIIAGAALDSEELREEIRKAKSLTKKPFGVNLMLKRDDIKEQIQVCIEEKVAVVTTGLGNPGPYMEALKKANIKVIPLIPSLSLALRMERVGADAVIFEGMECGGHIGSLTTMSALTQISNGLSIPVISAGGIANGEQYLAALTMGAEGIQCGTIFLSAKECNIHPNYKNMLFEAKDRATVITGSRAGHPVRVLSNKLSSEIIKLEKEGAPDEEIDKLMEGSYKKAVEDGDLENGSFMAGQVAALIDEERTCKEILEFLTKDMKEAAKRLLANLDKWL